MPLNDEWVLDRLLEISQAVESNATTLKRQAEDIRGLKPLFDRIATLETWRNGHEQWKDKELGNLRSETDSLESRVKTIEEWRTRHQQQTDDYVKDREKKDQADERESDRRFQIEHTKHIYMPMWMQILFAALASIFALAGVTFTYLQYVHNTVEQHVR